MTTTGRKSGRIPCTYTVDRTGQQSLETSWFPALSPALDQLLWRISNMKEGKLCYPSYNYNK